MLRQTGLHSCTTVVHGLFVGVQAMDVLDEFMARHSSTSKGVMAVDKNLSDQQKKEEGQTCLLLAASYCCSDCIELYETTNYA